MIKPMFGHRPKHKEFNYQPRYYDPKKDQTRRERMKIKRTHKKRHQGRSIAIYVLLLSMVLYLIYWLGTVG